MRVQRVVIIVLSLCLTVFSLNIPAGADAKKIFESLDEKEQFASDISSAIGAVWKEWQDAVIINNIEVEGSYGLLSPGDLSKPVFAASDIVKNLDREEKSQRYVECFKTVADAVENGMRVWQRGYSNNNIPFPQGAACTYTLTFCENVPVMIASGQSSGDKTLEEEALYNYLLYHSLIHEQDVYEVFKAAAKGFALSFERWKNTCSIADIQAKGGIAPQPAPMGSGPGPVRGAKGNSGKLKGTYFNGKMMYGIMVKYFTEDKG